MGPGGGQSASMLMNEAGEVTSHIQGMFNRTIKMMTSGIRPVYVFDGKPPQMKSGELAKRLARREKAEAELAAAKAAEQAEDVEKFSRRLVKVTRQHNEDCKELLRLMGVPVLTAPCEAEAQCAELARKGRVYGTATEDMDALTFQSPKLLRKLTFSQSGKEKQPVLEIDFQQVLQGLDLTYEQFVDLCILCGCDYCSTIKGIGPKTALKLIRAHKSIENVIKALKREKKYTIPPDWFPQKVSKNSACEEEKQENTESATMGKTEENLNETNNQTQRDGEHQSSDAADIDPDAAVLIDSEDEDDNVDVSTDLLTAPVVDDGPDDEEEDFSNIDESEFEVISPLYVQARQLFIKCEVEDGATVEMKWTEPDEEGLKAFLVGRMGFNEERVLSGIKRLKEAQQQKSQKRMDR